MKQFVYIPAFFLLSSVLLCADVLAQTKTPTLYQRLQPRSEGAPEYMVGRWITDGRWAANPDPADVNRDRTDAELGDASAQFMLALRYDSGQGVLQDHAKAVKWLSKAAEQDFANAQYNLGSMYFSGLGVPQDFVEASHWFRKAAEQGIASAQKNLGAMYGSGQGVPQNHYEAYVWSSIAVMSGNEGAINNRDFAASQLSPEDLPAARKHVADVYEEIQQRKVAE